jgi:hypothetical protein
MSGRKGGWIYIPVNRIMDYALLSVKPAIEPYSRSQNHRDLR